MEDLILRKAYITRIDPDALKVIMNDSVLTSEELLTDVEVTTLSILDNHLADQYDIELLLSNVKTEDAKAVRQKAADIALCLLYERCESLQIPEEIKQGHFDAMSFLKEIKHGQRKLDAPKLKRKKPLYGDIDFPEDDMGFEVLPDFGF